MRRLLFLILLSVPLFTAAVEPFSKDLYLGMRGDSEVARLQDFLRAEGHFTYPASTGNYLELTSEAVKKFQQARGITPADGNFGILTRSAANGIVAQKKDKPAASPVAPARLQPIKSANAPFEKDLYFGLSGDPEVARLQNFLRSQGYFVYPVSTGNYFTATLDAVKKFQQAQGVAPLGGYFGPQSRAATNRLLGSAGSGGDLRGALAPPGAVATTSPYKGKIAIGYVSGSSEAPEYESITIENRDGKEKINITGFGVENSRGGRFTIPQAHELPGFSASPQDQILLKPGERVIITAGKQEGRMDFRQNLCTGYFEETSRFIPSLSQRCPRPDTRRLLNLSDRCIRAIDSTAVCRQVQASALTDSDCSQYANENLNYAGCVRNYRSRSDFYSSEWLVWMQRDSEFFRNVREKVILKDQTGRAVDEYSY